MSTLATLPRGDQKTYAITCSESLDTATSVIFTAKKSKGLPDTKATFQHSLGAGLTVSGTTASVAVVHNDTASLTCATTLFCDIQASFSGRSHVTVWEGTLPVTLDVTQESDTSVTIHTTSPSATTSAIAAKTAAEAAQVAAEAAKTAAETAETNAETAETNAETAETNAEAAQAAAEDAAIIAVYEAADAASSATDAQTAQGLAEAAKTAAETAQALAESASISGGPLAKFALPLVKQPTGFDFTPPFSIAKIGDRFVPLSGSSRWSVSSLKPTGPGIYYVNVATGSDSNAGTSEALPLKSLAAAMAKANRDVIYVAAGHYDRVAGGSSSPHSVTRPVSIIGYGGDVIVSRRQSGLVWAQDSTHTNTYTVTRSATMAVLDASLLDGFGDPQRLANVADASTCNATPGSWVLVGSVVYVHTSDGRAPDANIWVLVLESPMDFYGYGAPAVYLENLKFIGGSATGAVSAYTTVAGQRLKFYAKNCFFGYSPGNGVSARGADSIIEGCRAAYNNQDGFNYHIDSLNSNHPTAIEIDCVSHENGATGTNTNNGSSIHDQGKGIRLNGLYRDCNGPLVVDVNDSMSWNLGCTATDSLPASNNRGFYIDGLMWLDTCVAYGCAQDIYAQDADHVLKHRNTRFATSGGNGTITTY
jgi:hypothetical protein